MAITVALQLSELERLNLLTLGSFNDQKLLDISSTLLKLQHLKVCTVLSRSQEGRKAICVVCAVLLMIVYASMRHRHSPTACQQKWQMQKVTIHFFAMTHHRAIVKLIMKFTIIGL